MKTILLVEDAEDFRSIVSEILSTRGVNVILASNGLDALSKLGGTDPPDLIVTDIEMPIMNGLELIKALDDHDRFRTIPKAICSWHKRLSYSVDAESSRVQIMDKEIPELVASICLALGV